MEITRGAARLREWLSAERRGQEWLGSQVGAHQTSVSRWLRGDEPPLPIAIRIRELTGIPVEAWVESATGPDESGEHAASSGEMTG